MFKRRIHSYQKVVFCLTMICLFSCTEKSTKYRKEPVEHHKDVPTAATTPKGYEHIPLMKREVSADNNVNIFEYRDTKITIEYDKYTYFGYGIKPFKIYRSSYDLDLGDLNLLRYDDINAKSQIYLVELNDYSQRAYHIYASQDNSLYYLGEMNIDLSKIIEKVDKIDIDFSIKQSDRNILIRCLVNGKDFLTSNYLLEKPLQLLREFNDINAYLSDQVRQMPEETE